MIGYHKEGKGKSTVLHYYYYLYTKGEPMFRGGVHTYYMEL